MNTQDSLIGLTSDETRKCHVNIVGGDSGESDSLISLSYGQQSLWLVNQLAPNSAAYNLMYAWRICSKLNISILRFSFQTLINRHTSLRTIYCNRDGKPMQKVLSSMAISFEARNASDWSDEDLKYRVIEAGHQPFNLSEGPLLRVHLFSRTDTEHTLLFVVHHIAADFTSIVTLVNELTVIYEARLVGADDPLPEPKICYTDFVHWQSELLAGADGEKLSTYWREQLSGELPVLNLPTDRPRPPVQTYSGSTYTFRIREDLTARLLNLAESNKVTLFVTLLSSFNILLYRYTGQRDILVGSPVNIRRSDDVGVVGYFVNIIILRAIILGDPIFSDFLQQVRQRVRSAGSHRHYPFSVLVETLQPTRDASRSPLTDVLFMFGDMGTAIGSSGIREASSLSLLLGGTATKAQIGDMELMPYELEEQESQVDLNVRLFLRNSSIFASIYYNTDVLDHTTITRMMDSYLVLLEGIVNNPTARLSELPVINCNDLDKVLLEWNNTETDQNSQSGDDTIHCLFEAQVERTPERIAVISNECSLTYLKLNQMANRLAWRLRQLGVGSDTRVCICINRSHEMLISVLGTLKAGGSYVPLDPSYPEERLSFMLENAGGSVLITEHLFAANLSSYVKHVVCLNSDIEALDSEHTHNPACNVNGTNLAYVIYTSGSTGKPKGVMIEHRSAINFARAHQLAIYQPIVDKPLQVSFNATFAFDASVERILLLLYGHTVHVWNDEIRHDPHAIISYIQQHKLEVLDFSPLQLRLLIETGLFNHSGFASQLILIGGEAIDDRFWRSLAANLCTEIFNVYGPTECTVNSSYCRIRSSPSQPSIGRPLANVQIYILDEFLHLVPIGAPGEVYIAGAGLACGYLGQPDLTAEKFIPNLYIQVPGTRLYKTSDRAHFLSNGLIKFLDRADSQVKIRGFRIELGEVEATLNECPQIKQAVVLLRENSSGDKQLVSYIVLQDPKHSSVSEIRRFLREIIPQYMMPSAYVLLDALPLMPNGKLDRKALPAPLPSDYQGSERYEAPQTSMEKHLVQLWENILCTEGIGRRDNFFELGGHSLLATQMIISAREAFNIELPLRSIFEAPTVADFALKVTEKQLEIQNSSDLEAIMVELEHLSDKDAQKLLGK